LREAYAMTVKERQSPGQDAAGAAKAAAKETRLADALRANLAKRKQQARQREAAPSESPGKPQRPA
jgi:hypothetical protein